MVRLQKHDLLYNIQKILDRLFLAGGHKLL